jgi:hypothetical protein
MSRVIVEFFPFEFRGRFPAPPSPTWQEQVIAKGWAYAVLSTSTIQADNGAGLTRGIIGLVNHGQPRKPDDWGALRAWAWGASRLLDHLETYPRWTRNAPSSRAFALRQGRARDHGLRAALCDRLHRSSGAGGAALARRNWGEKLENVAGSGEYHWMAGNYIRYAADPLTCADLPVDAHELIALAAPRPLFIAAGTLEQGDGWVDPKGIVPGGRGRGPGLPAAGQARSRYRGISASRDFAHGRGARLAPAFRRSHVGPELAHVPGFRDALLRCAVV